MSDHVWLCNILANTVLTGGLKNDVSERDIDLAIKASKLNKKGQPVPQDMCPKRVWGGEDGRLFDRIVDLFPSGSFLHVSERAADIIRQFDLGGGALYPVSEGIYQKDNKTRIPGGEFYTWIFGNIKTCFLEQHSPRVVAMSGPGGRDWCKVVHSQQDDDVAVSPTALEVPDVWVDPILFQSVFLCGPMGDALVAAGLKKSMRLLRVRVIG